MLAYDAVLFALNAREKEGRTKAWEMLCTYGMFHCGDSDSTGIISAAIWGAMHGFEAYESNYEDLEYKYRLLSLGEQLYYKSETLVGNVGNFESKNTVEDIGKDSELLSAENNPPNILPDPPSEEELKATKNNVEAGSIVPLEGNDELNETKERLLSMERDSQIGPSENTPSGPLENPASEEGLKALADSTEPRKEIGQSDGTERLLASVESDSSQIGPSENNPSGPLSNLASEEDLKASGDDVKADSTEPLKEMGSVGSKEQSLLVESDSQAGAYEDNLSDTSTDILPEVI